MNRCPHPTIYLFKKCIPDHSYCTLPPSLLTEVVEMVTVDPLYVIYDLIEHGKVPIPPTSNYCLQAELGTQLTAHYLHPCSYYRQKQEKQNTEHRIQKRSGIPPAAILLCVAFFTLQDKDDASHVSLHFLLVKLPHLHALESS